MTNKRIKICRIVTVPLTFQTLFREQIEYITNQDFDLTLVSSPGPALEEISRLFHLRCYPVSISRKPKLGRDLVSLFMLLKIFLRERFDIVHSSTPKAGLLTAVAGFLAGIPIRIHTFTGQAWMSMSGISRKIIKQCDWLVSHLNSHCYADSSSQRRFLINQGLCKASSISVLGPGSVGGVNLKRFNPQIFGGDRMLVTRQELGISQDSLVIIFVGRLTKDKGITELVEAFSNLQKEQKNLELVLVGPFESERDPLPPQTLKKLQRHSNIHLVGFSSEPERYMAAADVFCLPSYREGFGSVIIEAAAMGLPSVATRIVGIVDAIVDGVTGVLVQPKDIKALQKALSSLLFDPEIRDHMGKAARQRAMRDFDSVKINSLVTDEYRRLDAEVRQ